MFVYQGGSPTPHIYVAYVDDQCRLPETEKGNKLEYFNCKHPTIKFEMELSSEDDDFLTILDTAVQIDDSDHFQWKLFAQAANKGIILSVNCHQAELVTRVKKAMVQNEIKRANMTASAEYEFV